MLFFGSILYKLFKPIYDFSRAIIVALALLIGIISEVSLFIFVVATGFSKDGSIVVPFYSFGLDATSSIQFGGYEIWSWHILGILGLQIFFIVVVTLFQYAGKKRDGIFVIFFRNFSRLLLLGLAIGSIYQLISQDSYAFPRLAIIFILFLFMELTTLKVRLERKKWSTQTNNQRTQISSNIEKTESSRNIGGA
jgi:hypothetical protein